MENTRTTKYMPPVNQLLTYGEAQIGSPEDWPNYLELGLGPEQIPDLIRMAADEDLNWADSERGETWAPVHAWRTLGQLRAEEAIEPLLSLFETLEESDWVIDELPKVFSLIGPAALPALATYIADVSYAEIDRICVIPGVEKIAARWPEARPACIALLMKQLELFAENEPDVNGFLILGLTRLQATEAAPLIEQAFAARCVDLTLMGDWEDVQVSLGLLSAEAVEQRRAQKLAEPSSPTLTHERTLLQRSSKEGHHHETDHRKTKNQMAKQSRKKNRKR